MPAAGLRPAVAFHEYRGFLLVNGRHPLAREESRAVANPSRAATMPGALLLTLSGTHTLPADRAERSHHRLRPPPARTRARRLVRAVGELRARPARAAREVGPRPHRARDGQGPLPGDPGGAV